MRGRTRLNNVVRLIHTEIFLDPKRVIARDTAHSESEQRFYFFGSIDEGILTVRLTYRNAVIRIIGAGYWRKGKRIYEQENQVHE